MPVEIERLHDLYWKEKKKYRGISEKVHIFLRLIY